MGKRKCESLCSFQYFSIRSADFFPPKELSQGTFAKETGICKDSGRDKKEKKRKKETRLVVSIPEMLFCMLKNVCHRKLYFLSNINCHQ